MPADLFLPLPPLPSPPFHPSVLPIRVTTANPQGDSLSTVSPPLSPLTLLQLI